MTSHCEHEQSVLESLRSGTLHRGLPEHLERCEICQEVVFAAKCLQDEMAPTVATVHLPDAGLIWRRAQERAQARAVAKATLPILCARILAYSIAILAALWLVTSPTVPSWMSEIGLRPVSTLDHFSSTVFSGSMLTGIVVSSVCIGFSSWYVLRQD